MYRLEVAELVRVMVVVEVTAILPFAMTFK